MAESFGEDLTIEKRASDSLISFTSKIDNNDDNIARWWASHIRNSEKTKVVIKGKLIINSKEADFIYPFLWENEFQTNMLEGVNTTKPINFAFGLYTLQINLHAKWGKVTANETNIEYKIEIHNPSKIPGTPIVNTIEYSLLLNEINMAEGDTKLPSVIWSGITKSVDFAATLDKEEIKAWWVSHIKSGEKTSYRFQYSLLVKLFGATLGQFSKEIVGFFETDFLDRKSS